MAPPGMEFLAAPAMSEGLRLTLQVAASAALVVAVLWAMWRLPVSGERFFGWGPPLALFSAWCGLAGIVLSALMWALPNPDVWVVWAMLVLDPAALCAGILVLWIYRRDHAVEETVRMQIVQAKVGVVLGLAAVAVGYTFVMTHKAPFTPVG